LRRQEAPQLAHALDFAYLVGDALFEMSVELYQLLGLRFHLFCSLPQLFKQPRVFHCNDSLRREVLQ
jgi:hypothetical protein